MGVERSGGGAIGEKGHPLCMRDRKKCGWLLLHGCMQLKKELMEDEGAVKREIKGDV